MSSEQELSYVVQRLFRHGMDEAPPPPSAKELLHASQPWWELKTEDFTKLLARLQDMQVAYGRANPLRPQGREGPAIACLFRRGDVESEYLVRPIYFSVRDGRLRFRFRFDADPPVRDLLLEITFVVTESEPRIFSATADLSVENEYSLEVVLPQNFAEPWSAIKVVNAMPFRLIVRSTERRS